MLCPPPATGPVTVTLQTSHPPRAQRVTPVVHLNLSPHLEPLLSICRVSDVSNGISPHQAPWRLGPPCPGMPPPPYDIHFLSTCDALKWLDPLPCSSPPESEIPQQQPRVPGPGWLWDSVGPGPGLRVSGSPPGTYLEEKGRL